MTITPENIETAYSYKQIIEKAVFIVLSNNGKKPSKEDVEDLSQEIVLKVANGLDHFVENAKIETWITTIANNYTISFLRKKTELLLSKKQLNSESHDENINLDLFGQPLTYNENEFTMSPEQCYIKKVNIQNLYTTLQKLNTTQLKTMILLIEEKSYREIATTLNTTESSVKSLLFRAREKMKKLSLSA